MSKALDGHWDGIFNYPREEPSTPFTATLRQLGSALHGETVEPGDHNTLFGLLHGKRSGADVSFTKIYDNLHDHPIYYAGTLNADATEISGTWDIPGVWAGTFIMVRQIGETEEVAQKVAEAEPVR